MPEVAVQRIGEAWYAVWDAHGVVLEFSRLADHRDTLSAELAVTSHTAGSLHWSRVNLASAGGRTSVIKALEEVYPGPPWRHVLDLSCQRVAQQVRAVPEAEVLVPEPWGEDDFLIDPWIPLGQITVLYGDGGTMKSLFSLALALSGLLDYPLGGPWHARRLTSVLYLDWETDRQTHARRLWSLGDHLGLEPGRILYRRLYHPFTEIVGSLRADVDRHKVDFVVTDSLGGACGPEPESADAAVRTLMALRSLPATHLVIAHVSKASTEQSQARPFGSVYVSNIARSTIEARLIEDEGGQREKTVTYRHAKHNDSAGALPTALIYAFDEDRRIGIRFAAPDLASASLPARILAQLRHGKQTASLLAEELDVSDTVMRMALSRLEKRNKVVRLTASDGGRGRKAEWGRTDENRITE